MASVEEVTQMLGFEYTEDTYCINETELVEWICFLKNKEDRSAEEEKHVKLLVKLHEKGKAVGYAVNDEKCGNIFRYGGLWVVTCAHVFDWKNDLVRGSKVFFSWFSIKEGEGGKYNFEVHPPVQANPGGRGILTKETLGPIDLALFKTEGMTQDIPTIQFKPLASAGDLVDLADNGDTIRPQTNDLDLYRKIEFFSRCMSDYLDVSFTEPPSSPKEEIEALYHIYWLFRWHGDPSPVKYFCFSKRPRLTDLSKKIQEDDDVKSGDLFPFPNPNAPPGCSGSPVMVYRSKPANCDSDEEETFFSLVGIMSEGWRYMQLAGSTQNVYYFIKLMNKLNNDQIRLDLYDGIADQLEEIQQPDMYRSETDQQTTSHIPINMKWIVVDYIELERKRICATMSRKNVQGTGDSDGVADMNA